MTETPLDSIVVETILIVPERKRLILASVRHGIGDEQEVLEELEVSLTLVTKKEQLTLDAMSS
jgi:hypothetical protein